ncbi:MAG: C39 family peptidase, partial [Pseudomonadales bacterium]
AFSNWDEVTPFLAADLPVVASIRYGKDQLPGSPMPSTGGHLVVVFGVDERWVLVNDPAALDRSAVTLRYPRAAFEKAWFEHRGAGYVLLP